MKIGTLTLHRSQNYGGVLQAFALQRALKNLGFKSEVIDYWYPGSNETLYGGKFSSCSNLKNKASFVLDHLLSGCYGVNKDKHERLERSADFIENYIPRSKQHYSCYKDLKDKGSKYDVYIVGSDQVWNPNFKSSDQAFRLEFAPEGSKKISYAASFGTASLNQEQAIVYGDALKNFDHLSVRENDGAKIVNEIANKKATVVLDPTLLLLREEWEKIAAPVQTGGNYILSYFLGTPGNAKILLRELKKRTGLPVFKIGHHVSDFFDRQTSYIRNAGPLEFLGLFANASHVVTNSFHGTIFSIIFNKNFHIVVNTNKSRITMGTRLYSLTKNLNLEERIWHSDLFLNDESIKYEEIGSLLSAARDKSFSFLRGALEGSGGT